MISQGTNGIILANLWRRNVFLRTSYRSTVVILYFPVIYSYPCFYLLRINFLIIIHFFLHPKMGAFCLKNGGLTSATNN